jgi:hypothetical protein
MAEQFDLDLEPLASLSLSPLCVWLEKERLARTLALLLRTQDTFISLLGFADATPDAWRRFPSITTSLTAKQLLWHLMVLEDISEEAIESLLSDAAVIFPSGSMTYLWRGRLYEYQFKSLVNSANAKQKPSQISLFEPDNRANERELDEQTEDLIMLLLHGASSTDQLLPQFVKEKCFIGKFLGHGAALERYVSLRYILVSAATQNFQAFG